MDIERIKTLVTQKSGRPPQTYNDSVFGDLLEADADADLRDYLHHCLPAETYVASSVRVHCLDRILGEMGEASAPGAYIRPYGYLIIITSIGGNAVCVHQSTGHVFWTDHISFSSKRIMFQNRTTREWETLREYSPENVQRAMVLLSENLETFLTALLTDQLTAQLDALD